MSKAIAVPWTEAPRIRIPEGPSLLSDQDALWLSYETEPEIHAVVKFQRLIDFRLSPINDEGLGRHPYSASGLVWYTFHEILNSAENLRWHHCGARHWVISFKDNTLDVVATDVSILSHATPAPSPLDALLVVLAREDA